MDEITALRLQLKRNGYFPVPVLTRDKGPRFRGWRKICSAASEEEIPRWRRSYRDHRSTGILCGIIAAVDIDVYQSELADKVQALAFEIFGPTLVRFGALPKRLLPYRNDEPRPRISTGPFAFDGYEKPSEVEIRGEGQQFVAYGVHPDTGQEYRWLDADPGSVPAADLPVITADKIKVFLAACASLLAEAGGKGKQPRLRPEPKAQESRRTSGYAPLPPEVELALATDALHATPNNFDRHDWIRMGMAYKQAAGAAGQPHWEAWSATWPRHDPVETVDVWNSFTDIREITPGTLYGLAKEYGGWSRDEALGRIGYKPNGDGRRHKRSNGAAANGADEPAHDPEGGETPEAPRWKDRLKRGDKGGIKPLLYNTCLIVRNDPATKGKLRYDSFAEKAVIDGAMPWDPASQGLLGPRVQDDDFGLCLTEWLQRHYSFTVGTSGVGQAVRRVALERPFNPVKDYLDVLEWDGTARIDGLLSAYFSAEDCPLNSAIGAKFLISAVARIMQPGCKADHVLILEDEQGTRKSSALQILFDPLDRGWFIDNLGADLRNRDAAQNLQGFWAIEFAELAGVHKADVEVVKSFLTRRVDNIRLPYAVHPVQLKRKCVFIGTTNADTYLVDETGNRRFWPVRCGSLTNLDALTADRHQFWAEAAHRYKAGEHWWLEDASLIEAATAAQEERLPGEIWTDQILAYVDGLAPSIMEVTVADILHNAIGMAYDRQHRGDEIRVGVAMRARIKDRSWIKQRSGARGTRNWKYYRR